VYSKGPGPEIHRAGGAFVHLPREPSASAYGPRERLRPTRAPCSVPAERNAPAMADQEGRGAQLPQFARSDEARAREGLDQKIHRAGGALVHVPQEPSASAYCPQEPLRPTRAPCSVPEERNPAARSVQEGKAAKTVALCGWVLGKSCGFRRRGGEPRSGPISAVRFQLDVTLISENAWNDQRLVWVLQ